MATPQPSPPPDSLPQLTMVSDRVNDVLFEFIRARHQELEWREPQAAVLIEEVDRLLRAGGKRLRPAFCYWGYRAAGGADSREIMRAAAAFELLHTMALVHDDLIDGTPERRGAPTTMPQMIDEARKRDLGGDDPEAFAEASALLIGDLASVLADRLLLESGLRPEALARGLAPYHAMRIDMAVGQFLDLAVVTVDEEAALRIAGLRGGSYTVEGPLAVGAAFAGGSAIVQANLSRFGVPLGRAFQLRDDLTDGDAWFGTTEKDVNALVAEAVKALDPEILDAEAVEALTQLAEFLAMR